MISGYNLVIYTGTTAINIDQIDTSKIIAINEVNGLTSKSFRVGGLNSLTTLEPKKLYIFIMREAGTIANIESPVDLAS